MKASSFLKDVRALNSIPCSRTFAKLSLYEYPFDHQLLTLSPTYRESRKQYIRLGGKYSPRISSTMRSLSAQDLFANEIDYTPAATEIAWFADNWRDVCDPEDEVIALERFNAISVYHEQNHRLLWPLLPPAPKEKRDLIRYLNFAEALVVMLDLALADEIGPKFSPPLERMKVIYRTASRAPTSLLSMMCATYFILEMMNPEDILNAVDYVLPTQKKLNRASVARALDISELFTRITNPQWQERSWKSARESLAFIHKGSAETALYLPEDPLDFEQEFVIAREVLKNWAVPDEKSRDDAKARRTSGSFRSQSRRF